MDSMLAQQLFHILNWQSQKLCQLEQSMQAILSDLEILKKPSTPTIDKIEYNFDQLKIEKLEGTLNIGITSGQGKSIEDLSLNGQTLGERSTEIKQENLIFTRIQKNINHYLDTEIPGELQKMSQQYNVILDYEKHLFIIEDLRTQIDERIRHYNSEEAITEKVKKDISGGLHQYISKLSESEGESR